MRKKVLLIRLIVSPFCSYLAVLARDVENGNTAKGSVGLVGWPVLRKQTIPRYRVLASSNVGSLIAWIHHGSITVQGGCSQS